MRKGSQICNYLSLPIVQHSQKKACRIQKKQFKLCSSHVGAVRVGRRKSIAHATRLGYQPPCSPDAEVITGVGQAHLPAHPLGYAGRRRLSNHVQHDPESKSLVPCININDDDNNKYTTPGIPRHVPIERSVISESDGVHELSRGTRGRDRHGRFRPTF